MRIGFFKQPWQGELAAMAAHPSRFDGYGCKTVANKSTCRIKSMLRAASQPNKEIFDMNRAQLPWQLNTSNPAKMADFEQLFAHFGMQKPKSTQVDLREIQADPIQVVVHKASQLDSYTLVEDTALHIQGEEVGIHIRWLIATLPQHKGKAANLVTLLAYRDQNQVYIYEGNVAGTIVAPRGPSLKGFEINPYFLPAQQKQTLAEFASNKVNPRFLAFSQFVADQPHSIHPIIAAWQGKWQQDIHG